MLCVIVEHPAPLWVHLQAAQEQIAKQCPGVPVIYDTVDLHFLREARDVITNQALQLEKVGKVELLPRRR